MSTDDHSNTTNAPYNGSLWLQIKMARECYAKMSHIVVNVAWMKYISTVHSEEGVEYITRSCDSKTFNIVYEILKN
jgi:hypothetical protein